LRPSHVARNRKGGLMNRWLVKLLLVLAVAGMLFGSVGCQTGKGLGRDISSVGDRMSGDNAEP